MIPWIGAALFVSIAAILWWLAVRPLRHRVTVGGLENYFETLLKRGYPGGFAVIALPRKVDGRAFLQLAKYVSGRKVGLELAFPNAPWSRSYYEMAKAFLDGGAIPYREERTGRSDTKSYLNVDFGRDLDRAHEVVVMILQSVFGVDENAIVTVTFEGVSPHDVTIGF